MHVVGPVFVLAECATIACLVATTARLSGTSTTVPTVLQKQEKENKQKLKLISIGDVKFLLITL